MMGRRDGDAHPPALLQVTVASGCAARRMDLE